VSQKARNKNAAGLTLLELLVVVVIVMITAAIVIPTMSSTGEMRARSAATMIVSDLEYAQNVAITHKDPTTVSFDTSGESYTLTNASGDLIHPMSKSAYRIDFAAKSGFEDIDIVSSSFAGSPAVTFDELGAPDNPGSVTVRAGQYAYRIDVSAATGKVTVTYVGS